MPEGHSIHRHAQLLTSLFMGQPVRVSSPQGRFATGAAILNGEVPGRAAAWGKHLFVPFYPLNVSDDVDLGATRIGRSPAAVGTSPVDAPAAHWLHIHLGLYGRWRLGGPGTAGLTGAGITEVSTEDSGMSGPRRGASGTKADAGNVHSGRHGVGANSEVQRAGLSVADPAANRPKFGSINRDNTTDLEGSKLLTPTPTTRMLMYSERAAAMLTGPTRCEVISPAEVAEAVAKLGPDPVRNEPGDRERFIEATRKRRVPVGQIVMDQAVVAGPGNIYRAECLWRTGIDPLRPANRVSKARLGRLWDDLAEEMRRGVPTGIATTIPDEYRPDQPVEGDEELDRVAVYHRDGRPCVRCGTTVRMEVLVGRKLYWCPGCQR